MHRIKHKNKHDIFARSAKADAYAMWGGSELRKTRVF